MQRESSDGQCEDILVESDSESSGDDNTAEWNLELQACDFEDEQKDFTKKFNAMRVGQQCSNRHESLDKDLRYSKGKAYEVLFVYGPECVKFS